MSATFRIQCDAPLCDTFTTAAFQTETISAARKRLRDYGWRVGIKPTFEGGEPQDLCGNHAHLGRAK